VHPRRPAVCLSVCLQDSSFTQDALRVSAPAALCGTLTVVALRAYFGKQLKLSARTTVVTR